MMRSVLAAGAIAAIMTTTAWAGERPLGEPFEINGMEIAGVYLQPVVMEPAMPGSEMADMHIEADIKALRGNNNGFGAGEWVPYLAVTYTLTKLGADWSTSGILAPMVASDGPHYGANVKLDGPGKYKAVFNVAPPALQGFQRHMDKETGVGAWWAPFDVSWDFAFLGTGKKGGY